MESRIQIWTDGASNIRAKKKPGGWAYALVDENNAVIKTRWDGASPTTVSRMEMTAPLKAFQDILKEARLGKMLSSKTLQVVTDSALVYRCMIERWYVSWRYYGYLYSKTDIYLNEQGQIIKNAELWKELLKVISQLQDIGYTITWKKVRGHKGIIFNELVDRLAKKGKILYS